MRPGSISFQVYAVTSMVFSGGKVRREESVLNGFAVLLNRWCGSYGKTSSHTYQPI